MSLCAKGRIKWLSLGTERQCRLEIRQTEQIEKGNAKTEIGPFVAAEMSLDFCSNRRENLVLKRVREKDLHN